ncbi:hypothetical protein D0S48_08450 [Psychrobacillus sp. AK 1817]|nr:hypothetical protein D0S48_08450 [Psychrobacillus sp. AK 1817]
MEMAENNTPNQSLTSLQGGPIWRLLRVTLTGDTFTTPFNTSDVVFGGDLVGLSINGHVPPGTTLHGLGMNQVILMV